MFLRRQKTLAGHVTVSRIHVNNCKTSIAPISLKNQGQKRNKQNHFASYTRGQVTVFTGSWNRQNNIIVEKEFQTNMFFLRNMFIVPEDLIRTPLSY